MAEASDDQIRVCYLISVNRAAGADTAQEAVELLEKFKDKGAVGLELSGDPRVGTFKTFEEQFKRAQDLGFKISLHCAETKDQLDGQEMIDFKPDRLGHCCYLTKEQFKLVNDLSIPVEVCPTSNVACTGCGIPQFLKNIIELSALDHNTIICCDDTLLFNCNLSTELFEFCKAIQLFDKEKIKSLLVKNVDAIFLDDKEFKETLKNEI